MQEREVKKLPTLRGKTVVNLFFEDSTRTRISFEAAAKRLSADVINFSAKGSSVSKGESLKDTAQTLAGDGRRRRRHPPPRLGRAAHASPTSGWIDAGVVNAGDGTHEHPTQALLDAFTIRRRLHGAALARTRPRRRPRRDRRRHPALARRPLERVAAHDARRGGRPRRAAHPAAGRHRRLAGSRRLRPRRGARRRRPTSS